MTEAKSPQNGTVASARLAEALAARFGLGAVSGPMRLVDRGVMGRVWLLPTESGRWAAKTLLRHADPAGAETDVRLQEAALAAGVDLPKPVRTTDGQVLQAIRDRMWRIYEWREFGGVPAVPVESAFAAALGATLRSIHDLALPADGPPPGWFTQPPTPADWHNLAARARAGQLEWASALEQVVPAFVDLGVLATPSGSPATPVLTHRDLTPDNVRIGAGHRPTILDWENAGPLEPLSELGYVLLHWCYLPDGSVDDQGARALVDRYFQGVTPRPRPGPDLFAGAVCSWLNFTAGTVNNVIKNEEPDNLEFRLTNLRKMLGRPLTRPVVEELLAATG